MDLPRNDVQPSLAPVEATMTQLDKIKVGQLEIRYLIDGAALAGMGVLELTIPAGSNVPPPHSHTHNEE
jgi:hypothetical protein